MSSRNKGDIQPAKRCNVSAFSVRSFFFKHHFAGLAASSCCSLLSVVPVLSGFKDHFACLACELSKPKHLGAGPVGLYQASACSVVPAGTAMRSTPLVQNKIKLYLQAQHALHIVSSKKIQIIIKMCTDDPPPHVPDWVLAETQIKTSARLAAQA